MTAFACMTFTDDNKNMLIAVFHRKEDAEQASDFGGVVEINPTKYFHEGAIRHPKRIGVINSRDLAWRDVRPLFGEI